MIATFANGCIPLSVEGIQSQIRLARQQHERETYPVLKAAERDLDRLTLEMCAAERAQGNRLEDWLVKAELAAFTRTRERVV